MACSVWAKVAALAERMGVHLTASRRLDVSKAQLRVREIVRQIESEIWAGLRLEFIPLVRFFLSESLLEKSWKIVGKAFGPLESVGDPIVVSGWWLTSIKVPLRFQHAEFGMLLQMTSAGSLVGLRFLPMRALGLGAGWQMPCYADNIAREFDITLGKSESKVGGTFCLPNITEEQAGIPRFPCVVFLAGSGPCDRDSTVEDNKPFKDLAWGLARHGIASIRFDKVTRTYPKVFRNRKNMTLTDEYVEHTVDAILQGQNHPNVLPERIFVLGHSLGAVVAPIVAAMEASVAGCVIMAGPAEPMYRSLIRQLRYIQSLDGPEAVLLGKRIHEAQVQADLADSDHLTLSTPAKQLPFGIGPSYWLDYRKFDPIGTASSMRKPILIMQGGRDYQVTVQDDYKQWHTALHGKHNVQFHLYEQLNHLFIAGKLPSTPLEYSAPGNIDEQVIIDLAKWVHANVL
ncbi:uncharacterized protein N7484_002975 [Penicillium longicatenatum]|uniref:uncharacterized protein n=1 Tax=Penicillium longicatenatum TaxID=1561947 RepID=UPI00254873F8|nr:uncharacterized protein N7484_002975 [Penicillium longicatenatum]KAJ5649252.1 hypothetical protein N7484_002975 [Penicillium longicatenatum]